MTALLVPGEATATPRRLPFPVIDQEREAQVPSGSAPSGARRGRFASRFEADLLTLAEAGR